MALTKPILNSVAAWDVTKGVTFTFNVIGGDQVVGTKLFITENVPGIIPVYVQTTESFKYEIVVPPNPRILANGKYYTAKIVTIDARGNESPSSNEIQFYCYTTPSFVFNNISQGGTVTNSTFVAEIDYNQVEDEALSNYIITLYNASQTQISTSGIKYTGTAEVPLTVSHIFSGLEDNTVYYIHAVGQTINGTFIETPFIRFTVQYSTPSAFSQFFLTNNCSEGYITYTSATALIEGTSYPPVPTFVDDSVDLTQSDSYVKWSDGFEVEGDFTLKAWLTNPTPDIDLMYLSNGKNDNITIGYHTDELDNSKIYADLRVAGYYIYTPSIVKPLSSDKLCLQIRRIGNIYEILLEVV